MWTNRSLIGALTSVLLACGCMSQAALAGTTGVISGKVTNATTGAPLAGVHVAATAPTGNYATSTDASGFYSITGVTSDTYTVTFSANGYDPLSVQGVNVFADQTATVSQSIRPATRTLGKEVVHGVSGG